MRFSLLLFAILALALTAAAFPKIDSRVFEDTENGKTGSFSIHLRSKANLSGLRGLKDKKSLGWKVLSTLKETAESSQADLLSWLRENKEVERVAPFYIANFIIVDAKRPVVEALAKRRDIKAINANRPFKVSLEVEKSETVYSRAKANEWNLDYVHAPLVWEKYGTTGTGIYANADTGVEYTHEALLPNYKGNSNGTLNHNFNWWDGVKQNAIPGAGPCGVNSQVPCDDNNHGSHTTGTSVGQNGIGVAPGAKWIACRNMDRGYGSVESYMSCLQFFLAPTDLKGSNPNPDLRPLAIGNSYGCVSSEGCSGDEFTEAVEALRAAGIFMSVSAGNSGPSCNTITDPPATEPSVISVGATAYQSDGIASFSSRGPVRNAKKPTVVAPGSAVRSAVRGGGYSSFSGTSMASPHIGGYVNLIVAICPELAYDVDALEQLLISTTKPLYTSQGCGGDTAATSPNNVFGYGILDIEAAAARCVGERK